MPKLFIEKIFLPEVPDFGSFWLFRVDDLLVESDFRLFHVRVEKKPIIVVEVWFFGNVERPIHCHVELRFHVFEELNEKGLFLGFWVFLELHQNIGIVLLDKLSMKNFQSFHKRGVFIGDVVNFPFQLVNFLQGFLVKLHILISFALSRLNLFLKAENFLFEN